MQEAVAKRVGFAAREIAGERQRLGVGEQVLCAERELHPGLVHLVGPERQLCQSELSVPVRD